MRRRTRYADLDRFEQRTYRFIEGEVGGPVAIADQIAGPNARHDFELARNAGTAAIEVTSEVDAVLLELHDVLGKAPTTTVTGAILTWTVELCRKTRVKDIRDALPGLVRDMEAADAAKQSTMRKGPTVTVFGGLVCRWSRGGVPKAVEKAV